MHLYFCWCRCDCCIHLSLLFMGNHVMRIVRTQERVGCAPEFANYSLAIDITLFKGVKNIKELSVRVYNSDFHFMGTDVRQMNTVKAVRHCHFDIGSSEEWTSASYRFFVYVNNVPRWFARVRWDHETDEMIKVKLEQLDPSSLEMFFAENLCFQSWWNGLERFQVDSLFVSRFMERIYCLSLNRKSESKDSFPCFWVSGEYSEAENFANTMLASYIKSETNENKCLGVSLEQIPVRKAKREELVKRMQEHSVVVVGLRCTKRTISLIRRLKALSSFIGGGMFPSTSFVFFGGSDEIKALQAECLEFAALFSEENYFRLPEPVQEEDDFEQILNEFIETCKKEEESAEAGQMTDGATQDADPDKAMQDEACVAEQSLQAMVGLSRVKSEIKEARLMALFTKERQNMGLDTSLENRNHMLFLGNPGTGKTTVAKLVGKMYHSMGLLSSGHTVETCRTDLVGEFIGHTEQNMKDVISHARGGVLFIDEAYTLISHAASNDFGREVVNALLTVLSEPNPDMIVILAGYEDKMQVLLNSNPGLKERFPLKFYFEDYTAGELWEIAHGIFRNRNFELTKEADEQLFLMMQKAVSQCDGCSGNGRWVHNLVEHGLIKSMAKRVMAMPSPSHSRSLLTTIELSDVQEAEQTFLKARTAKLTPPRRIGFTA